MSQDVDARAVRSLTRRYVVVYALATFGDWIQGAYLYAAYRGHGLAKREIGCVYVLGYAVSATIGTAVAAMGDGHGHKRLVEAYGWLYAASCGLLRSNAVVALLTSRVLGGVAYSLLFSSFESWVITEADEMRIDRKKLVGLFSVATFFNAASAVAAGLVGNLVVQLSESDKFTWIGMEIGKNRLTNLDGEHKEQSALTLSTNAYTPAFDVGAVSLILCAVCARILWPNRTVGRPNSDSLGPPGLPASTQSAASLMAAMKMIIRTTELFSLGITNSLYEASLHLFVFVWTPVLEKRATDGDLIPHGLLFSAFMICKMVGSQAFNVFGSKITAETMLRFVLSGSALCFTVATLSTNYWLTVLAFCAFEFGLGVYWPTMSILRAQHVPNKLRATMTSAFRIPLNFLVVALLLCAGYASDRVLLGLCAGTMFTSAYSFQLDG